MDEDARLMLRFGDGDRAAFETLFRRYTPPLIHFLARMVGDRARAEELTQDVFVRIHQARERYEPRARFSTWMFGIARRLALNELDRAHRKRESSLEQAADRTGGELDRASADPGPEELVSAARTGERIDRALEALPERQRTALVLRTDQRLSYDEIAQVLDTTPASVKSLLNRARTQLVGALKEET